MYGFSSGRREPGILGHPGMKHGTGVDGTEWFKICSQWFIAGWVGAEELSRGGHGERGGVPGVRERLRAPGDLGGATSNLLRQTLRDVERFVSGFELKSGRGGMNPAPLANSEVDVTRSYEETKR